MKDIHEYDDIISLPHPDSAFHPRMSLLERAAQFSPFAALTGYGDAVKKTAEKNEQQVAREIQRLPEPDTMP